MLFSKRMMLMAFLASATLVSCSKKSEVPVEEVNFKASIPNYDKLVKFIGVIFKTEIHNVKFDQVKQEYFINGSEFRMSLNDVENLYNNANEYKLNYEN